MKEVPKYCCEENRHEWQNRGEVWVQRRFLWLTWTEPRDKYVCKCCSKVFYAERFDGI